MDAVYGGYTILVQPKELTNGRWEWDVTILPGSNLRQDIFSSLESYSSCDEAERAAFEHAKKIIDCDD